VLRFIKKQLLTKSILRLVAVQSSEKQFVRWDDAKKIMLIFDGSNVSRYPLFNDIVKKLTTEGKKVSAISWYPKKELADSCLTQNNIVFFSKRDLNWFGMPDEHFLKTVTGDSYDLCLNLSLTQLDETSLIMKLCDAKLKVSQQWEGNVDADFMLEISEDRDEKFFVEQIIYYLRTVNANSY
jgi:hypothetical protein